ncbi:MAG: hypothetical protein AAB467_00735 [Patescibacteria group bacterium]
MLLLTQYVARHELGPLQQYLTLDDVLAGAEKVLKGLAVATKPPRSLSGFRFYKVRIGALQSARMIVFVLLGNEKVVPLIIRLKKDKLFGANMAMNNPALVRQLNSNLDRVLIDIEQKQYQEFDV